MKYKVLLFLLLLLSGCRGDVSDAVLSERVRRGSQLVGTALTVVPTADPGRTRSAYGGDPDCVSDWCLFQFDAADGVLAASYYQASGKDMTHVHVVTGHPYDWYAVANVGDVTRLFTAGVSTEAQLEAWTTGDLDAGKLAAAGGLPMSWTERSRAFSAAEIRAGASLSVNLVRLAAKFDITISRANLSDYVFTATGLTMEGTSSVKPFAAANRASAVTLATDRATAADIAALNAGDAATFYALENMYGDLLDGNTDRWRKKPANLPETSYPTYVEVKGTVRQAADAAAPLIPVTYRFYLGCDATRNFDVVRNTANTVTLLLSDAAVEAAIAELEEGDGGDPIWKIEAGSYSDDRSLAFGHECISLPTDGTPLFENIVKSPSDLPFVLKMDQALINAGVKVFSDAAMTDDVTPSSGTASVALPGSVTGLYFFVPSGGSPVSGTVRIQTADGKKSDELNVASGRALVRLDLYVPAKSEIGVPGDEDSGFTGASRYPASSPMDTIIAQYTNRVASAMQQLRVQFIAVYSDGSEKVLKNKDYSLTLSSVTGAKATVTKTPAVSSDNAFFNLQNALTADYAWQSIGLRWTGLGTASASYTEGGVTASVPFTVQMYSGVVGLNPACTPSERIRVPFGESATIKHTFTLNDAAGTVYNVSSCVASSASVSASTMFSYDGYDDATEGLKVTAKQVAGDAYLEVGGFRLRDLFGAKVRDIKLPPDGTSINSTSYGRYSRAFLTSYDPRVLDHIAFEPDYLYVGNTYNAAVASPAPDDAANAIWHYRLYAHYTNGTKENISSLTTDQGLSWADHGVSENLSSIWRFHTSGAPEAYDGYRAGWRFFDYNQGEDYLIVKRLEASGSGEGAYARALFAHFDDSGVEEEGLSLSGIPRLPQDLWTASYTFNGVTKSAAVRAIVLSDLVPVSLEVDPSSLTLHPYGTATASVTVVYSDGTRIPASSAPGSFTVEGHYGSASTGRYHGTAHNWGNDWASYCINPSMTTGGVAVLAKGFTGSDSFSVKYEQGSTTLWADVDVSVVPEPASIYPVSLTITPNRRENVEGNGDNSFVARASMSDGSTRNVSTVCDWSFENSTVAGSGFAWYVTRNGERDFAANNSVEIWGGGGGSYTDIVATYTLNGHTVSDRGYMSIKASAPVNHGSVTGVELQWKLHDWDSSQWSADAGTVGIGDDVDIRVCKVYADGYRESTTLVNSQLTTTGESLISWTGSNGDRFTATATGSVTFTYADSTYGSDTLPITIQATSPWAGPVYWVVVEANRASGNTSTAYGEISTSLAGGESVSYHAYYGERDGVGFKDNVFTDVTNACTWTLGSAISTHATGSKTGGAYVVTSKGTNTTQLNDLLTVTYNGAHMVNSGAAYPIRITLLPAKYLTVDPTAVEWDYFEGAACPKSIQVTSNVSWNVEWVSGGDKFTAGKTSGSNNEIILVSPASTGTGAVTNTGRLRVYNSEYGLEAFVDLKQYDWTHGPDGLEREIVELYIDPADAEVNHGATQDYQVMVHWRERQNGGSWTDHNDPVHGHGSQGCSWSVSAGGTFSVAPNGVGTLTNTNSGSSAVNATVTVILGSSFSVYSPGADVLQYALGQLVNAGVTLTTGVTLQPGGIVTTYKYKVVTAADPTAIQVAGEYNPAGSASVSALSAELFRQTYENGALKKDWESQGSVTSSGFTAVSGGSAVTISGATATAASAGTAVIRSAYAGESGWDLSHEHATLIVSAATPAPVITYGGFRIETAASQIECNGSTTLKAYLTRFVDGTPDTEIEVTDDTQFSVTSGGSYASVSGNTVTGTNASSSDRQVTVSGVYSGSLVSGSVSATAELTVKARTLTDLFFDQSHYDLVRVSGGEVSTSHGFRLTARYSDGQTEDVTADAVYSDQGSVVVEASSAQLTATAACSGKQLTAAFGGISATASYSAEDLEIPEGLEMVHFESQDDPQREFLIDGFKATLRKVLSGSSRVAVVTDDVVIVTSGPVVADPPEYGTLRFHFTAAGEGALTLSYTCSGVTFTRILNLSCSDHNHVTYTWR